MSTLLGAAKIRTSSYRPQADGQIERFNRTLLNMLIAFVLEKAKDWDQHLPYVMLAYRSSVHSSTGCTPQVMVYGRESNLPIDLMYSNPREEIHPTCGPEYVELLRHAIRTSHDLQHTAICQKRGYDAHAKKATPFEKGDLVLYYYPPLRAGNKFASPWTGPWRIIGQPTEIDHEIELVSNPKKHKIVHRDVLKRYECSDISSEMSDSADTLGEEQVTEALPGLLFPWDNIVHRSSNADTSTDGNTTDSDSSEVDNFQSAPSDSDHATTEVTKSYYNSYVRADLSVADSTGSKEIPADPY